MKEKYFMPEMLFVYFTTTDIITTSNGEYDELPDIVPED